MRNKSFGASGHDVAHGRVFKAMEPSKRRPKRTAKHTRFGPFRDIRGDRVLWHTTQQTPWVRKKNRRAASARAEASRRANR